MKEKSPIDGLDVFDYVGQAGGLSAESLSNLKKALLEDKATKHTTKNTRQQPSMSPLPKQTSNVK